MKVDHQASQPRRLSCRDHASARWRQFGTDSGASGNRHESHDPARLSRPEGRAVDLVSRAGPSARQIPRRLGSSTLLCAPRGVHWIEADILEEACRASDRAGWIETHLKHARRPGGSIGAEAALGRSDIQYSVMCHSRCVVWLMMSFVRVFEIPIITRYFSWHAT